VADIVTVELRCRPAGYMRQAIVFDRGAGAVPGRGAFNAQTYIARVAARPSGVASTTRSRGQSPPRRWIFWPQRLPDRRYKRLAAEFYDANRRLALRRAGWGGLFTTLGTVGYYLAFAYIAWRTLAGEFSIGDLTFLAGSFLRLRTLLEGLLTGFSSTAGQALYLNDLFSFFEVKAEILSPVNALPFPRPIRQGFAFEDVHPPARAGRCAPASRRRARWWRWSARTVPARPRW
jgi:ATP-binding cassette subfamily B protein